MNAERSVSWRSKTVVRESTQSWREVLLKLKSRGMNVPKLAIGDGAMGFWAALEGNLSRDTSTTLLDAQSHERPQLPAQVGPGEGETGPALDLAGRDEGRRREGIQTCSLKPMNRSIRKPHSACRKTERNCWPFTTFRPSTWQSIRTTNPIESTFATIRHRTKRSRGCLTRDGMLHMMFKLGQCAENNWRRLRGFDDLSKVIIGVKFNDGVEATQVDQAAA